MKNKNEPLQSEQNQSELSQYQKEFNATEMNNAVKQSISSKEKVKQIQLDYNELEDENVQLKQMLFDLNLKHSGLKEELQKMKAKMEAHSPIDVVEMKSGIADGVSATAGQRRWPLWIWKIILEQLVNNAPPSSITANIISVVEVFSPNTIVKDMMSTSTIRRGRMVLHVLVKICAAHTLALIDSWRQLFADGTSRRESAKQNLIIAIGNEVGCEVIPILLSTNIIPENEKSKTFCQSLLDELENIRFLLNKWRETHHKMYGTYAVIQAEQLCFLKLTNGECVNTGNHDPAERSFGAYSKGYQDFNGIQ